MQQPLLKPMLLDLLNKAQAAQQTLVDRLSDAERAEIGTADHWSAKDQVAHITFWKQRLSRRIAAAMQGDLSPSSDSIEHLNAQTFVEQCERLWSDILHDSEQAHRELLTSIQRFTEDILASSRSVPQQEGDDSVFPEGRPLWAAFLRNGYWHLQSHLNQFYLDRGDVAGATRMQEEWINALEQHSTPPVMRGIAFYNLACFYATTDQVEKARPVLEKALQLTPGLTERSEQDEDLAALRGEQAY